ncbi:LarC family nickel insertion protein, partial [Actinoplanes sp. KI2]|uniref:LarC family nickel insertion protein n=1 Tax=Actinoplanes sp. KI2 TaxID=2983315 RepID=UPI0021D5878E
PPPPRAPPPPPGGPPPPAEPPPPGGPTPAEAGELATPTGMALLRTFADVCEPLPAMELAAVGIGAGTRDPSGRANIVRVLVGTPAERRGETLVLLEANIDDLDPRLWPGILAGLLDLGAADAWLTPILMKKGRPAHTLSVLCREDLAGAARDRIFRDTSTLGVRHSRRGRVALDREFVEVSVGGGRVRVKVGSRNGVVLQVMPEFEDVAALARAQGRPERVILQEALAAAARLRNRAATARV